MSIRQVLTEASVRRWHVFQSVGDSVFSQEVTKKHLSGPDWRPFSQEVTGPKFQSGPDMWFFEKTRVANQNFFQNIMLGFILIIFRQENFGLQLGFFWKVYLSKMSGPDWMKSKKNCAQSGGDRQDLTGFSVRTWPFIQSGPDRFSVRTWPFIQSIQTFFCSINTRSDIA